MAYEKIRGKLFVFSTCLLLIECRSFLQSSVTKDGGREFRPGQFMPDHEGFGESVADLKYLGGVAALQKKKIVIGQLVSSSEAALGAMSPKLWCGDDLMKLQLNGPEVAQIELYRDNGAPVSLTELPPHCGHTIPTNGGLVYTTPYDGCGVVQQGGSYAIQIQWNGETAVISCPIIPKTADETFLGPNPPTYLQILPSHFAPDALSPAADPMPEPFTSETGEESTSTSQEAPRPQPPGYPQAFPQRPWPYYYHHYHYPGIVYPTAKPTGPTTKPTVVQAPAQKPQLPGHPHGFWLYYYPHYHHGRPKPAGKPVPASMHTTTSVAQAPTQKPQFPGYPLGFWPYYPHYHPHGKPKPPKKPAIPTASPATTQKPQPPMYPGKGFPQYNHYPDYSVYLQQLYSQYPEQTPNIPNRPPITTTPQASTAAAGCGRPGNQPPNEPPQYYIPSSSMLYEEPFTIPFMDADSFP